MDEKHSPPTQGVRQYTESKKGFEDRGDGLSLDDVGKGGGGIPRGRAAS